MRAGIGYDVHRLVPGRGLALGGVKLDRPWAFVADSDGDVVVHAVIDALLGACGLGDIGEWFPDTDPAYKGMDSRELLKRVVAAVAEKKYQIENVDVIVHAEQPKLGPHKPAMRATLADLLGIEPDRVNVKAKTNEGLDAVGRREAIAAWAAVVVAEKK